jgi:hypothetical protein
MTYSLYDYRFIQVGFIAKALVTEDLPSAVKLTVYCIGYRINAIIEFTLNKFKSFLDDRQKTVLQCFVFIYLIE